MADERNEVLEAIRTRAASLTGKDASEFSEDTAFKDLQLKSVQYSQLTTYLEDEFDVEVPYMTFRRKETFGDAADYVVELLDM